MKILGYDVTGGWDIDQYSPQQGHIIKFYLSDSPSSKKKVSKIIWNLNGEIFEGETASHIFRKDGHPGEGYIIVKCKVYYETKKEEKEKQKEKHKTYKKKFLIVPEVSCQIQLEMQPPINNDTKSIDLKGQIMCSWLRIGNVFNGNNGYACGGACVDQCPQYEVLIGEIKGTHITHYGKHTLSADQKIRGVEGENSSCIPLYQNNYLGLHSKYPDVTKTVCILPQVQELDIQLTDKNYVTVDGLSKYMLPCNSTITWNINGDVYETRKKPLKVGLTKGDYLISVSISIDDCPSVDISKMLSVP